MISLASSFRNPKLSFKPFIKKIIQKIKFEKSFKKIPDASLEEWEAKYKQDEYFLEKIFDPNITDVFENTTKIHLSQLALNYFGTSDLNLVQDKFMNFMRSTENNVDLAIDGLKNYVAYLNDFCKKSKYENNVPENIKVEVEKFITKKPPQNIEKNCEKITSSNTYDSSSDSITIKINCFVIIMVIIISWKILS